MVLCLAICDDTALSVLAFGQKHVGSLLTNNIIILDEFH